VREHEWLPRAPPNRIAGRRFVRFAPRDAGRSTISGGSPQKNFALVNPFLHPLSRPRNRIDAVLVGTRARAKSKQYRMTKTRNSSAFLDHAQNRSQMRACAKVCSLRILPNTVRRLRGRGAARHLHTKLSGVTVIFFLL
jgi:hypothetical protein